MLYCCLLYVMYVTHVAMNVCMFACTVCSMYERQCVLTHRTNFSRGGSLLLASRDQLGQASSQFVDSLTTAALN